MPKIKEKCLFCKKYFYVYPSAAKQGHTKFCSMKCRRESQEKIKIICKICNKEFKVIFSHKIAKFCSHQCYGKWRSINFRGINNPMYGIHRFGKDAPNWKGGISISSTGYILIKNKKHPFRTKENYIPEHRLIMEKYLRRYLKPGEIVHHINNIHNDNRLKNLVLFKNRASHRSFHNNKYYNSKNIIFDGSKINI